MIRKPLSLIVAMLTSLILATACTAKSPAWLKPVVTGLNDPVLITHAGDGSGDHYVIEQAGVIYRFDSFLQNPIVFLDIRKRVHSGGERGLLGLAFHPNYTKNGRYFVYYTAHNGDNTVAEFNRKTGKTENKLLAIKDFASNHNGGMIAFGKDGLLYIGTGDGGGAGDPKLTAQNPRNLLGKMLRIDVTRASPADYGIPVNNPYSDGHEGAPEIFAQGLRNPWRFSFDRETGDLYIGDVGQDAWEEVDFIARQNLDTPGPLIDFGWSELEANHCFHSDDCIKEGFTAPILEYSHSVGGCSVTGGYVYRGERAPSLNGHYLYGDFCSGKIWTAKQVGNRWQNKLLEDTSLQVSSFGENEAGDVFVIDYANGTIYRIEANP